MAKMSQEVQDLFNKMLVEFATVSADGQPNVCVVGMKKVIDDETVYLSDQFFYKTAANLKASPKVALVFYDQAHAYQIHGTARYVNEGEDFAPLKEWADSAFAAQGAPVVAKGGCFVHVDAVYNTSAGPNAGEKIS